MSNRRDYYRDPDAPRANSLVPGGSALIVGEHAAILMQRRTDSGNWSLPGGTMEIGETLEQCVIRETKEETGLDIEITGLLSELDNHPIHDTVRLRLRHHAERRAHPYLGRSGGVSSPIQLAVGVTDR